MRRRKSRPFAERLIWSSLLAMRKVFGALLVMLAMVCQAHADERWAEVSSPHLKGAELLGLAAADCLVIEDSAAGVQAGHAAGCKVLATLFSYPIESLAAADWIVNSLQDVSLQIHDGLIELEFTPVDRETAVAVAN